jgi:hypothetical protein
MPRSEEGIGEHRCKSIENDEGKMEPSSVPTMVRVVPIIV